MGSSTHLRISVRNFANCVVNDELFRKDSLDHFLCSIFIKYIKNKWKIQEEMLQSLAFFYILYFAFY
jgi:hypothetical protein